MKRFVISEDERSRILSMHESATKRQYLSEQQGTKVADPNAHMYDTPRFEFLLKTNVPEFFTKNKINFEKVRNNIEVKNINGGYQLVLNTKDKPYIWVKSGGDKYLENYSGNIEKYKKAFKEVNNIFNSIKNDRIANFHGCITDKTFHPSNPTESIKKNDSNCKGYAEKLDKVFKETKLKDLDYLADTEKFIIQAREMSA